MFKSLVLSMVAATGLLVPTSDAQARGAKGSVGRAVGQSHRAFNTNHNFNRGFNYFGYGSSFGYGASLGCGYMPQPVVVAVPVPVQPVVVEAPAPVVQAPLQQFAPQPQPCGYGYTAVLQAYQPSYQLLYGYSGYRFGYGHNGFRGGFRGHR